MTFQELEAFDLHIVFWYYHCQNSAPSFGCFHSVFKLLIGSPSLFMIGYVLFYRMPHLISLNFNKYHSYLHSLKHHFPFFHQQVSKYLKIFLHQSHFYWSLFFKFESKKCQFVNLRTVILYF